jgi:diacylglycerol O-acyltransferase / wax synthase
MAERLSPTDVSFLYMEEPTTPMHVGGVSIFQAPEAGFDHDRLVRLIRQRIAFVPRFRQRLRSVPGRLANPVWVDDGRFDLAYHVRRSALPRPGTDAQLRELVARLMSRPLDRQRPLWEMYLVEGLSEDRFAIVSKTHFALIDGVSSIDITQVILDSAPASTLSAGQPGLLDTWRPGQEPSWFELVAGAVSDAVRRPAAVLDTARASIHDLRNSAERLAGAAGGLFAAARTAVRTAPPSPLNVPIGAQRRFGMASGHLDDYKRIRKAHSCTVNDVVLAAVAGALRAWLQSRGIAVTSKTTIRTLVPVSVRGGERSTLGNRVAANLIDLPVGEPSPAIRLEQISYAMRAVQDAQQAVGAEALVGIAGFAPPTLHALGARATSDWSRRLFNLMVINVPGPQFPLYAAGAQLLATYPVLPLAKAQAVSVGLTSYNGGMFYGLNADRDAMPDVDVLAQCLTDALEELVETVR